MKKIFAGILVLVFALTMSGCVYWDGLSKSEAREFVEKTLEEKYGEEFVVKQMYLKSGSWDTASDLMADCSPKSDENIVFSTQTLAIGKERVMRDTYIPSIIRSEILDIINSVLSEYSIQYVVDVDVQGLYDDYDSGIRSADDATIKNFTEALPDINITDIWIALNDKDNLFHDNVQTIVEKMTTDFYYTNALIHFYYVTDDVINRCIDESQNNSPTDRLVFYRILYKHYPCDAFNYKGKEDTLLQIDSADEF